MNPFKKYIRQASLYCFCITCFSAFFNSCEDPLPEYVEPKNTFESNIVRVEAQDDTVEFVAGLDGNGTQATYAPFYIICSVTNIYEETFQYEINPKGVLEIWITDEPKINVAIPVSLSELIPTVQYNPSTNILTLDPHQQIFFRMKVDLKFSSGFYIHTYATVNSVVWFWKDHYALRTYDPFQLKGKFSMQLDPRFSAASAESTFSVNLLGRFYF